MAGAIWRIFSPKIRRTARDETVRPAVPAKAGTHSSAARAAGRWTPAFTGKRACCRPGRDYARGDRVGNTISKPKTPRAIPVRAPPHGRQGWVTAALFLCDLTITPIYCATLKCIAAARGYQPGSVARVKRIEEGAARLPFLLNARRALAGVGLPLPASREAKHPPNTGTFTLRWCQNNR